MHLYVLMFFFLKIDHNDTQKPRDGQSKQTVPIQIEQDTSTSTRCGAEVGRVKTPVTDILMTGAGWDSCPDDRLLTHVAWMMDNDFLHYLCRLWISPKYFTLTKSEGWKNWNDPVLHFVRSSHVVGVHFWSNQRTQVFWIYLRGIKKFFNPKSFTFKTTLLGGSYV